jgi:two-component system chemotaxis response regulator CheB
LPDVVTLDVEMPRMDGITFLRKLMSQCPVPVVMCSSLTEEVPKPCFRRWRAARSIILKPRAVSPIFSPNSISASATWSRAPPAPRLAPRRPRAAAPEGKLTADAVLPPPRARAMSRTTEMVVCIGASTGGTEALREVLGPARQCAGHRRRPAYAEHFTVLCPRLNACAKLT